MAALALFTPSTRWPRAVVYRYRDLQAALRSYGVAHVQLVRRANVDDAGARADDGARGTGAADPAADDAMDEKEGEGGDDGVAAGDDNGDGGGGGGGRDGGDGEVLALARFRSADAARGAIEACHELCGMDVILEVGCT